MQQAIRSPHTSPSLRSIAHMHNRASYFPSPPVSPVHASPQHHSVPSMPASHMQHQSYPVTSSPLASPRVASPRPMDQVRSPASRRPTYTSAIPLGYGPSPVQSHTVTSQSVSGPPVSRPPIKPSPHTQSLGDTRRRPSFKIDLPPRPAPAEILAVERDQFSPTATGRFTPSKIPRDEVGAGRKLSLGPLEMTDLRTEIDSIAYQAQAPAPAVAPTYITAPGRRGSVGPTFRDPFAGAPARPTAQGVSGVNGVHGYNHEGGYMIIRAPTMRLEEDIREGSPKWRENDPFAGAVGLGYSLNRLRAPTPWVRKSAEEGEWLTAEDVAGLQDRRE